MSDLREDIARIIDPSKWRTLDSYLESLKRKYRGVNAGYDPDAFKDSVSLSKADQILKLVFGPDSLNPEGEL